MADNIKTQVLTVDVGGAITNIKEYQKHIDNLKGTLLGLEKGTEEYNKVQKQLREEQDKLTEVLKDGGGLKDYKKYVDNLKGSLLNLNKDSEEYKQKSQELVAAQEQLNEVMAIGKTNGEALEGSYNYLSKQMSELKKEWKATADEAERAALGEKINDINNKLKDMDASVGVFNRNVGNYSKAYEEAFKNILQSTSSMGGVLGTISKDIKGLIPVVKAVNQQAIAGLTGVKKAIAATGIGALVILVGTLVQHFDSVRRAVGVTDDKFKEFKETAFNVIKNVISWVVGLGNSVLQFLIAPLKASIESIKGIGKIIGDIFKGNFSEIKNDAKNTIEGINNVLNNSIKFKENFGKGREFADNLITNIQNEVKNKQDKNGGKIEVKVDIKPILSRLEEYGLSDIELLKLQTERRKAALTQQYEEEKALLEQNHIDTTKLTAEYMSNLLKLDDEYNSAVYQKMIDADNEQLNELLAYTDSVEEILTGLFDEELMMKEARNIASKALDDQQKEDELKTLEERRKNINSFVQSTTSIISQVADAWESSVKSQIESGKISQKEGERQFEVIKAIETAVAIVNTLSAGVAAFKGITTATGGWGLAAAIAQMVAVIGTGMAQVAKIQSTQLGTTATQVTSVSTPNLGSIVNEYNPQVVQNATGASEAESLANALQKTPLYVSVTDIDRVQNTVKTRENENSW